MSGTDDQVMVDTPSMRVSTPSVDPTQREEEEQVVAGLLNEARAPNESELVFGKEVVQFTYAGPKLQLHNNLESSAEIDPSTTPTQIVHHKTTIPYSMVRRRRQSSDQGESSEVQNAKRVAIFVPGPNQRAVDEMREREEAARKKAISNAVLLRAKNQEIQTLNAQREAEARLRAVDLETETQMTEQILQYENEIIKLNDKNKSMTLIIEQSQQEMLKLQKNCEELSNSVMKVLAEKEREKTNRETEILTLRQRLREETNARSSPLPHVAAIPKASSNHVIRGSRTTVGVVPLKPPTVPIDPQGDAEPTPNLNGGENESTIQAIVKEVFKQLKADVSMTVTGSKTKNKCSTRTLNQRSIEQQKKIISQKEDLAWKEAVRQAWKTHFNVTSAVDFAHYIPASQDDVREFEDGQNGPDERNILDFGRGFEKSRWNKTILKRLIDGVLEDCKTDGSWNLPDVSNEYLLALFYGQLKRSREAWKLVQNRPNIEEGRMETAEEVAERISAHTTQRLAIVGSRSRRERKFERRTATVEKVISIKASSNAPDLETWKYFRDLLAKLSVDGMSSEEEGVAEMGNIHVPVFRVKICAWRNPVITDYFKYIDTESQNRDTRPTRGSKCHPRMYIDEPGLTPAPKQLPVRLYNDEWLREEEERKGKDWIDEELCVSREVFELLQFVAQ